MRILAFVLAWQAVAEAAPPVAAHHGGAISVLAVTEDGGAAVTTDQAGVRLWPSLDGKREPVVVKMTVPASLAIGRDGDQLVIGGIDSIGTLELVRVTGEGALVARAQVELDVRCHAIYVTSAGLLVWRDDQTLALLDLHGARIGTLAADPGQRLDNVLVRKDRALALVTVDGQVHGRWLELGAKVAWGADTPVLAIDPMRAALSPDHRRVVAAAQRKIGIVDLATGRATIVERIADDNLSTPLGFIDDETFVFDRRQAARYWVRAGKLVPAAMGSLNTIVVDHQLVGSSGIELVVQTPRAESYLGYRIARPRHEIAIAGGVAVSGGHSVVLIDDRLHTRKVFTLAPDVQDVWPVDGSHAVVLRDRSASVIDLAKPEADPDAIKDAREIQYEPSTHLVAVRMDRRTLLTHYDPKRGQLGSHKVPYVTALDLKANEELMLIDPAWARGMVAVIIDMHGDGTAGLRWIRAVTDTGILEGDPTTHDLPEDWLWTGRDLAALGLVRDIVRTRGSLRAELRDHRLSLRDGKTLRWVIPAWGVDDIAWHGERLLVLGDGAASIDPATGTFEHAQCGWDFGLWDEPNQSLGGPVLCEN